MNGFEALKFKGTFRDYQQSVIDRMDLYLENKRIHIVAAPGSGKTTLGIELIRRIGQPTLILSPSITIRNQWQDRVNEGFLSSQEAKQDYVSTSLKEPRLMISATYQSLHASYKRLVDKNNAEDGEEAEIVDYSQFDLVKMIRDTGIKTFCLDEAHHLRSEWYKSLTEVLNLFSNEITLIALTATPPYDSDQNEWDRYVSLCGEIDEEIFVPQLISQNNLCPHQDYVYFNYPTKQEKDALNDYRMKAIHTVKAVFNDPLFVEWMEGFFRDYKAEPYRLFEYLEEYRTLVNTKRKEGVRVPFGLERILGKGKRLFSTYYSDYETLFSTILTHPEIFGEKFVEKIRHTFQENGLMEFGIIHLDMNTALRRQLISSIGKLGSIGEIARFESQKMGHDLQMLVLTDYIKKELLPIVGSEEPLQVIGAVPIFEVIRRNIPAEMRLGLLTGSLMILPSILEEDLIEECASLQTSFTYSEINKTQYRIIRFAGGSKSAVKIITTLFENGKIDILVGTKALLGEGWDSPCINTLIMASFVGSFMLSNQMRGRAIRINPKDPRKVASIWHLATIEPNQVVVNKIFNFSFTNQAKEKNQIVSQDFETLKRRFQSFLGPRYSDGSIESGIERLDFIEPPFSEARFQEFNKKTLSIASNREMVWDQWRSACPVGGVVGQINDIGEVPTEVWPVGLFIYDSMAFLIVSVFLSSVFRNIPDSFNHPITTVLFLFVTLLVTFPFLKRMILNFNPPRAIKTAATSIFRTMKDVALIKSKSALPVVKKDKQSGLIHTYLENASRYEKGLFATALREMLSSIDNPRYVAIETRSLFGVKVFFYSSAFSVPTMFTGNANLVQAFTENLTSQRGKFEFFYTRSESGRKIMLRAKRRSNLTRFNIAIAGKRVLSEKK